MQKERLGTRKSEEQKTSPFLTNRFKLWIVALIFFLIYLHLFAVVKYRGSHIVSTEVILGTVLALVGYLWIQELRDRHRLQLFNKALLEAQDQLKRDQIDTIATLILTEEAKDPYVRGHSKRVARCSLVIAQEMGFPKERQRIVERAGLLHDLGKLSVVDGILNKTDKLNDEEWKIMKNHPRKTVDILEPLKYLSVEKKIILHHHERYDGGGYPDGLKGEEIPLEARILAVADSFDAMNSERPYRKALNKSAMLSELKKVSGSQLDASVVTIFLRLLEKSPNLWEKD